MTNEQMKLFRERLATNRQPVERSPYSKYDHPRGWNDALDFVEKVLKEVMGEKSEP